jgi:hypothetical protein
MFLQATDGVAIDIFGSGDSSAKINNSKIIVQNVSPDAIDMGLESIDSAQIQLDEFG